MTSMEEKTVITNSMNEQLVFDKHTLFLWKCEEKKVVGKNIEFRFSRDDSLPYIEEIRKLENEFGEYHVGSMLPTIVLPAISIVLFTVFLIIYLFNKDNFNFSLYFFSILLPALFFLLVAMVLMFLRTNKINKITREKPLKEQEYKAKIDKIIQPTIKK